MTLEDILEELVGELEDEFDRLPRMFHALSGETWMVGGGTPIADVLQQIGVPGPWPQGLMSAWMIQKLGRPPRAGDSVNEADLQFTVRRVRRGRVFEAAVLRRIGS